MDQRQASRNRRAYRSEDRHSRRQRRIQFDHARDYYHQIDNSEARASVPSIIYFVFGVAGLLASAGFFAAGLWLTFCSTRITSKSLSPKFSGKCLPAGVQITWPAFISRSSLLPPGKLNLMWASVRAIAEIGRASCRERG